MIYAAYEMAPRMRFVTVLIRVAGNIAVIAPAIRKLVSSIDQDVPAYQLQTLERQLAESIAPRRFNMFLLSWFATAAIVLALIGLYGVIAYLVAQRTREIGIRVALGARRSEIMAMVLRHGGSIVITGTIDGLIASLGLGRLMSNLLYGVKPDDASTLLAAAAAITVAALIACIVPAFQAARLHPLAALRHE